MASISIRDLTERPRCRAQLVWAPRGVRSNRALAERLAVVHRAAYELLVPHGPASRTHTPEEKLLRAIFGTEAERVWLPEVGATLFRGDPLVRHPHGLAHFHLAAQAEVESVTTSATDLPDGCAERITVIVRWPGPLTVGDTVTVEGGAGGVIDAIVDDASEPRLYLTAADRGTDVERSFPTATERLEARSTGDYDSVTLTPLSGLRLRDEQLEWLAQSGGEAVVSELAAFATGEPDLRVTAFERQLKLEALGDGWSELHPQVEASPTAGGPDPLAAFGARTRQGTERLRVAGEVARTVGLSLELAGRELTVSFEPSATPFAASRGAIHSAETFDATTGRPVMGGLHCPRLFGPLDDYRCECGRYERMKSRGVTCERCGVEVIASKARRERSAHIALPVPLTPTRLGVAWPLVPVLPPGLRRVGMDEAYAGLFDESRRQAALDAVVDATLDLIIDLLYVRERHLDYSGTAVALVATRRRVPLDLLIGIAKPLLLGWCEAQGYTTTVKSSKKLLATRPELARELARMVLHDRVLLFAGSNAAMVAGSVEIGDDPVIELDPETATQIGVATGDLVSVYLPLSAAAQAEAKRIAPRAHASSGPSWIRDVARAPNPRAELVACARRRAIDPCVWEAAALLVGGWPFDGVAPPLELGAPPPPVPPPSVTIELDRSVDELELSVATSRAFSQHGIATVRDLVSRTEADLLGLKGFGPRSLKEVKEILASLQLTLGMTSDDQPSRR